MSLKAPVISVGRNLAAVQKLFASLPPDLLQTATDAWLNADGKGRVLEHHQLSIENRNAIREFECHQAYLVRSLLFFYFCVHGKWRLGFRKPMPHSVAGSSTSIERNHKFPVWIWRILVL